MLNILVTTFAGLGLPRTINVLLPGQTPVRDAWAEVVRALSAGLVSKRPQQHPDVPTWDLESLILTTNTNLRLRGDHNLGPREAAQARATPIQALLPSPGSGDFLTLRASLAIKGGKGGFGSQLRAAGGRMASRKKKRPQANEHASSRNLDGRRIRTITEAKNFAEFLVTQPELARKSREEQMRRLEAIVMSTERRKEEILTGKNVRLDGRWIDAKERAIDDMRYAILAKAAKSSTESRPGQDPDHSTESSSGGPSQVTRVYGWESDGDYDTESESAGSDAGSGSGSDHPNELERTGGEAAKELTSQT